MPGFELKLQLTTLIMPGNCLNKTLLALSFSCLAFISPLAAQSRLETARTTLKTWIETEKTLAREESQWALDKDTIEGIIEVINREIETLEEKIQKSQEEISKADAKRGELLAQKEGLKNASGVIQVRIAELEKKVHSLYPLFPEPLKTTIDPLYSRMPKGETGADGKQSLSARMQNVIGILSQVDKFNGNIILDSGLHQLDDGRQVTIKTLYLGIAYAYFIDSTKDYAGYGVPEADGWNWVPDQSMAQVIDDAVRVYEDPQRASYINLPVTIR